MVIEKDLPMKISLNKWYAGEHWSFRKKIKDLYKLCFKGNFREPCEVEYDFEFRSHPLDCTNCVAMVKMIEDCLFQSDGPNIVKSVKISSKKGVKDKVTIKIWTLSDGSNKK